ncbi:chloride channel protein [Alloacidobacterium sp.]|uniref:chloride channel protein n=1 Tax=Alloacidobacterium sp. TaxID=2951999 RepID=UPI002D46FD64|nr:chloride channel protein [Alloacidobacterium sp.]HYK35349.1 chloride channel protein [Alloacidobacterium sp.]
MSRQPTDARLHKASLEELGDFTTDIRVLPISLLAIVIGVLGAYVAWFLIKLIGIFTNAFYYQRFSTAFISPANNQLGAYAILVPVVGSLIVGFMARYGAERIRGHGIPEAIESILINGSKVRPRLAILKPLSAAISIGSGGPFGAEGPIIMTGGAFGSLISQFFHLTSMERRTLLVAGASAGMSATFAAPLASVLIGVELLLFEWKPRSAIPVALASATACVVRRYLLGVGPLFPVSGHPVFIGPQGIAACALAGVAAGILSALLTLGVYACEDLFRKLPIHWMWWPAIGGVFVGIGGLIFPQALGVGYDTIRTLLAGNVPLKIFAGVLLVKSAIWMISLGSGTSGGVLAPLLMMGAALGGIESTFLPDFGLGFWPLVSMGAILGGTMRSPFTGIVFAIELTHDVNMLLPLLVACFLAHAFTVLTLRRSILTEKISRRGYHLSREYGTDPLEILFVREVMRTKIVALPGSGTLEQARELIRPVPHPLDQHPQGQHLFPVIDGENNLLGVVTRNQLLSLFQERRNEAGTIRLGDIAHKDPITAFDDEPLRAVVHRMAETSFTRFPVLSPETGKIVGMVSLTDLLRARSRNLEDERAREQVLRIRLPFGRAERAGQLAHRH